MASAEEIRAAIKDGNAALRAAIEGAGAKWEQSPAPEAEGEESWSPRQAAEHVIATHFFFASRTAQVLERSGPEPKQLSLASAEEALTALSEAAQSGDDVYAQLADADLSREAGRMGTLGELLAIASSHLSNHAKQIEAAS